MEEDKAPTWAQDVFEFLKKAEKRGEVFDLIILDPPTFSRGARRRFSTEKDLEELAGLVAKRLAPGAKMFVSVNTQGLTPQQFRSQLASSIHPLGLKVLEVYPLPRDFRLSSEEEKNPPLKSCLIA